MPLWNGLGIFSTALLLWIFVTPCGWQSPSLYLPPLLVGLLTGTRQRSWTLRMAAALVYGLALMAFAGAIVFYTDGPWDALYPVTTVILLLMVPLTVAALAFGETVVTLVQRRLHH